MRKKKRKKLPTKSTMETGSCNDIKIHKENLHALKMQNKKRFWIFPCILLGTK